MIITTNQNEEVCFLGPRNFVTHPNRAEEVEAVQQQIPNNTGSSLFHSPDLELDDRNEL
jgi:hypothetical protein